MNQISSHFRVSKAYVRIWRFYFVKATSKLVKAGVLFFRWENGRFWKSKQNMFYSGWDAVRTRNILLFVIIMKTCLFEKLESLKASLLFFKWSCKRLSKSYFVKTLVICFSAPHHHPFSSATDFVCFESRAWRPMKSFVMNPQDSWRANSRTCSFTFWLWFRIKYGSYVGRRIVNRAWKCCFRIG